MNAASGGTPARGVAVGHLTEVLPDRIVVGISTLYLRDGDTCAYAVGTLIEAVYTEQDGRKYVDSVSASKE